MKRTNNKIMAGLCFIGTRMDGHKRTYTENRESRETFNWIRMKHPFKGDKRVIQLQQEQCQGMNEKLYDNYFEWPDKRKLPQFREYI